MIPAKAAEMVESGFLASPVILLMHQLVLISHRQLKIITFQSWTWICKNCMIRFIYFIYVLYIFEWFSASSVQKVFFRKLVYEVYASVCVGLWNGERAREKTANVKTKSDKPVCSTRQHLLVGLDAVYAVQNLGAALTYRKFYRK